MFNSYLCMFKVAQAIVCIYACLSWTSPLFRQLNVGRNYFLPFCFFIDLLQVCVVLEGFSYLVVEVEVFIYETLIQYFY